MNLFYLSEEQRRDLARLLSELIFNAKQSRNKGISIEDEKDIPRMEQLREKVEEIETPIPCTKWESNFIKCNLEDGEYLSESLELDGGDLLDLADYLEQFINYYQNDSKNELVEKNAIYLLSKIKTMSLLYQEEENEI